MIQKTKITSFAIAAAAILTLGLASVFAAEQAAGTNKIATIGTVDKKGGNLLTLTDKLGGSISFTTTSGTKVFSGETVLSLLDVVPGNLVAAIATQSGVATESATAATLQKLYVEEASNSAKGKQELVQGIVTGVNAGVLTIAKSSKQDQFYNMSVEGVVIKTKDVKTANSNALVLGQGVIVVGTIDDTDTTITPTLIQIVSK